MPALIRIPVLLVAALMVSGASGQDNASPGLDALLSRAADARSLQQLDRMMAEIETLAPVPDLLPRLLAANPNAYVYALQSGLREAGYASPLSGIFGLSTVTQLSAFCADTGIDAQCRLGPLLPDVASAIGTALAAGNAAPAEATAPAEPPAIAPAPTTSLPSGWSIDDGQPFGIETSIAAATATGATIRLAGTPTRDGWLNIYLSPPLAAGSSGHWTAGIGQAAAAGQADAEQTVRFLVALRPADGGYMGELFDGVALPEAPAPLDAAGTAPAGTALLQPYVQVRFTAAAPLAITLSLDTPALAATD